MKKPAITQFNEAREYQLRCTYSNGETEVSKWYDTTVEPEKMKRQLAEMDDIELLSVIKRIKGLKDENAPEEQPATLEGKCGRSDEENTEGNNSTMIEFKEFIKEEMSTSSLEKAALIILKYLRRKTGNRKIFNSLGVERYKNANSFGVGIRYFAPGKKIESWRFNWKSTGSANYNNLQSIDIWVGRRQFTGPTYSIEFDTPVSLVQVLPRLVDILTTGKIKMGEFITYPNDPALMKEDIKCKEFKLLREGVDPDDAFNAVIKVISKGEFNKSEIWSTWKAVGIKILDELMRRFSGDFEKSGRGFSFSGDVKKLVGARDSVFQNIGTTRGKVTAGSNKEVYAADNEIDELEKNRERLTYEKQIEDLTNLIKMTISGASNALFVAGRGGIGKTHTVEKVLASSGLEDGKGYFKNTGTASAAGIYSLLFKYKDSIILFDDSDDALKDQESRNIFKAATDTKKIRKLVWNKMGAKVVDPDSFDGTDDDMIDQGFIPRFFEFTGKIIFISNLSLEKLDPDGAIRTRAFLISIDPTDAEVYDFMEKIVNDIKLDGDMTLDIKSRKHIVDLLRQGKSSQTANLRKLGRALNMSAGAMKAGVDVSDNDLKRMISTYA